MQDWLPAVAALIGALATFGIWAYVSRRRLVSKDAELERALDTRTTELESARIQLQRLSTEDSLTAVANHEQFLEFLEREWRRSRRDGLPLTLIFLDIDHFRAYNRQFGRKAGDEVLKQVGRVTGRHRRAAGRPRGPISSRRVRARAGLDRRPRRVQHRRTPPPGDRGTADPGRQRRARPRGHRSVATATAVPQRESAWEELDLIKAARHALREARATGGNRVLRANLGMAGPPELVRTVE